MILQMIDMSMGSVIYSYKWMSFPIKRYSMSTLKNW